MDTTFSTLALIASFVGLLLGLSLVTLAFRRIGQAFLTLRAPLRRLGEITSGTVRVGGILVPASGKSEQTARTISGEACLASRLWIRDGASASTGAPDPGEPPHSEDVMPIDLKGEDGARVRVMLSTLPWTGVTLRSETWTLDELHARLPEVASTVDPGRRGPFHLYEAVIAPGSTVVVLGRARRAPASQAEVEMGPASQTGPQDDAYRDVAEIWTVDAEVGPDEDAMIVFGSRWKQASVRVLNAAIAMTFGLGVIAHSSAYLAIRWYERMLTR